MQKRKPTIGIVIPAYNEAANLAVCLDSIAAQTVPPDEVIVVDNNSTDDTATIARSYEFVTVVHERRQGITFAREAGFNAVRADIIGRIDADIRMPKHWVDTVGNYYANQRRWRTAWTGGGFFYNVRLPHLVSWAYRMLAFHFNRLLTGTYTLWGSNMALPRQLWLEVRGELCSRTDIHEDLDIALHLRQRGVRTVYDHSIKTRAKLKRVQSNRDELWGYLLWWPRTLRVHGRRSWVVCFIFGTLLLYPVTYILVMVDWLARHLGKRLPQV